MSKNSSKRVRIWGMSPTLVKVVLIILTLITIGEAYLLAREQIIIYESINKIGLESNTTFVTRITNLEEENTELLAENERLKNEKNQLNSTISQLELNLENAQMEFVKIQGSVSKYEITRNITWSRVMEPVKVQFISLNDGSGSVDDVTDYWYSIPNLQNNHDYLIEVYYEDWRGGEWIPIETIYNMDTINEENRLDLDPN